MTDDCPKSLKLSDGSDHLQDDQAIVDHLCLIRDQKDPVLLVAALDNIVRALLRFEPSRFIGNCTCATAGPKPGDWQYDSPLDEITSVQWQALDRVSTQTEGGASLGSLISR